MPDPAVFERFAADEIARHPSRYSNGGARAFVVARDGQVRGLLWGTMHIGYGENTVLPGPVRDRFAQASDLTVEITLDHIPATVAREVTDAARKAVLNPDPAAIAKLDPPTRAALANADLPSGSERLSLMGLNTLVLGRALAEPSSVLPQGGIVDVNLIRFARGQGIPVYSLEQPQMQTAILWSDPNGADAAVTLTRTLRLQQNGTLRGLMAWVRDNYGRGRIAETLSAMDSWQSTADDAAPVERTWPVVFSNRNHAWLPRLDARLALPGFHFIAFGAGHLMGDDGVVALLRGQGWTLLACPGDFCPTIQ